MKLRRILLVPCVLLLTPLLVELGIQLVGDPRRRELEVLARSGPAHWNLAKEGFLELADEELHFRLCRGKVGTYGSVTYRINEHGMRGPSTSIAKPAGTTRLLALGDSYCFGIGVPEEESLPVRLETALNADGRRVEAINMSVPAYHTGQEATWLEREGFQFEPDLLLLVYCHNDNTTAGFYLAPSVGNLYVDETPLPFGLKSFLSRSWLYSQVAKLDTARRSAHGDFDLRGTRNWPVTCDRIRHIARMCREHGVPFLLVALPELSTSREFWDDGSEVCQDYARVKEFAATEGIELVDLLSGIRAIAKFIEPLLLNLQPKDAHLNSKGYEVLARLTLPHVKRMLEAVGK